MKKLFLLIGLTLILITNVNASPSFLGTGTDIKGSSTYTVNEITYNIIDRSRASDGDLEDVEGALYKGYSYDDYSGYYIGTVLGNDSEADILNLAKLFLNDDSFEILDYYKYEYEDEDEDEDEDGNLTPDPEIEVTFTAWKDPDDKLEPIAGTWKLISDNLNEKISFYSVKGSNEYALYYVTPPDIEGLWVTAHLEASNSKTPAISHFTGAAITTTPGTNVVPEPGTMMLLGFGLIGFAGVVRRKRKI